MVPTSETRLAELAGVLQPVGQPMSDLPVRGDTPRFILVDDDLIILETVRRLMPAVRPDWSLTCVADGRDALRLLQENPVDALVTDLCMPGMDGEELLSLAFASHPEVVCIIHSTQPELASSAIRRRVHAVLPKPTTMRELCGALETALQSRHLL